MKYKMSEIINKFLLTGDKFMPEMHLRQSVFTYSACAPFTKNKERIKKFKEAGDSRYIYPNKLDKTYFQHDMAYGDFRDLKRRIKYYVIKHLILQKIQNMMDVNLDLLQLSINFLIKELLIEHLPLLVRRR